MGPACCEEGCARSHVMTGAVGDAPIFTNARRPTPGLRTLLQSVGNTLLFWKSSSAIQHQSSWARGAWYQGTMLRCSACISSRSGGTLPQLRIMILPTLGRTHRTNRHHLST